MSYFWDPAANRFYTAWPDCPSKPPAEAETKASPTPAPTPESQVISPVRPQTSDLKVEKLQVLLDQLRRSTLRCEAPIVKVVKQSANTVSLHWEEIFNAKAYEVFQKTSDTKWHFSNPPAVKDASVEVLDLEPGRTYQFKIRPMPFNSTNEALDSAAVEATTLCESSLPYVGIFRIADSWVEVELVPIKHTTRNEVLYREEGQEEWISQDFPSAQRLIRLENLVPGSAYELKVVPHGDAPFPESKTLLFDTDVPVTLTTAIKGEVVGSDIHLQVDEVLEATSYIIEINQGSGWNELTECISSTYVAKNLIPGQTYQFRATPLVGNSKGVVSGLVQIHLPIGCGPVRDLRAESKGDSIVLSWTPAQTHTYSVQLLTGATWTSIGNPAESPFTYTPNKTGAFSFRVVANCQACAEVSNTTISRLH